jgi:MFS family permease
MMLGLGVRCGTGERCRYRQNWLVITSYCTLIGLAYSSALPSLHQFVTSSAYPEDDDVQPGLGLSETWYSWIVSIQSIGELAGAIAISLLLRWFYTKYLMLISLAVCGGGGVLYGVGKYGWMLLIGRFLMGSCQGAVTVILRTYIGETSSTIIASLPPEQREKSTLKYTAFFVTFTVCTLSVLAGPVRRCCSIAANTL